eukprot:4702965-Pyramimonas_sp.AAC.1
MKCGREGAEQEGGERKGEEAKRNQGVRRHAALLSTTSLPVLPRAVSLSHLAMGAAARQGD